MGQPSFETVVDNGKTISRYGFMREVDYVEQFHFWSANEYPSKIWRTKFHGHVVLEAPVAVVAMHTDSLLGRGFKSTILNLDPAFHDYALSGDVQQRTQVGLAVSQQAIFAYLHGNLDHSPGAQHEYVGILNDHAHLENLRQLGLTAL